VVLGIFVHLIRKSEPSERAGLIAALVLTLQTVFFFIFYQQMSTSLSLFALRNVDLEFNVLGRPPVDLVAGAVPGPERDLDHGAEPGAGLVYTRAGRTGKDLSIAGKFALGFAVVAAGFFTYGVAGQFAVNGLTSSWIMIAGYGLYSLGELLVSGLGLAMVARYVPARMGGFMMGAYFVATGISQYLGGVVANYASVPQGMTDPLQTLPIYTSLFNKLGIAPCSAR
jgi:POT family proton-dependent oligopeptide transporter